MIETIKHSTAEAYCAAIVDLWREQVDKKANSKPNPRIAAQNILSLGQLNENRNKLNNYENRGAGTLADGYTSNKDIEKIDNYLLYIKNQYSRHALCSCFFAFTLLSTSR